MRGWRGLWGGGGGGGLWTEREGGWGARERRKRSVRKWVRKTVTDAWVFSHENSISNAHQYLPE